MVSVNVGISSGSFLVCFLCVVSPVAQTFLHQLLEGLYMCL